MCSIMCRTEYGKNQNEDFGSHAFIERPLYVDQHVFSGDGCRDLGTIRRVLQGVDVRVEHNVG